MSRPPPQYIEWEDCTPEERIQKDSLAFNWLMNEIHWYDVGVKDLDQAMFRLRWIASYAKNILRETKQGPYAQEGKK